MTRSPDGEIEDSNSGTAPTGESFPSGPGGSNRARLADLELRTQGTKRIEPGSSKLIHALRFVGYTFEQAIADVVDNSISAKAKNIVLRFITEGKQLHSFVIADNGQGMDESRLDEAMRFGSHDDYDDDSLGKYGLGLKLASLSQAGTLEVLSRRNGMSSGRRWTLAGLSRDWHCEVLEHEPVRLVMDTLHPEGSRMDSGTLIVWKSIDRLNLGRQGLTKALENLSRRLHTHLGLHFHRFMESQDVQMWTEIRALDADEDVHTRAQIEPINPFGYATSGHADYPRSVRIDIPGAGVINVRACIWPPNSKDLAYKLGGKAAQRQGFYFYRRDRLIQAGGWNGVVEHEAEPHSSLARLAIELPPELDSQFGLSVQKSKVITPPAFVPAVTEAKDQNGDAWLAKYRKAANHAYRHDNRAFEDYPLLPTIGLPSELVEIAREELAGGRQRNVRSVKAEWAELSSPDFFEIDRERLVIRLNKSYRTAVLGGRRGTSADAPIIKLLLFMLLREDFDKERMSSSRKEQLDALNRLLSNAVSFENRN